MPQVLRPYQAKAAQEIQSEYSGGMKSVLAVAPTGAGKTSLGAHLINEAAQAGDQVFFLAHRKELITQCSKRLDDQGINHGIIKAGNKRVNTLPVQVASVQTLINRVRPKEGALLQREYRADLIIIDEAHRAGADSYKEILKFFPAARVLGLTATPYRGDGKGLADLFQTIVKVSNPPELTALGYLVPARVFTTPLLPNFDRIKTKMGEFDKTAVDKAMDQEDLVGDIYSNWKRLASDRQTIIFACSIKHAAHILAVFEAAGESICYVDAETSEEDRDARLGAYEAGKIQIVVNVGILTEGYDAPATACVVLARPTKSLALYIQMGGRGLRTLPGEDGDNLPMDQWHTRKKKDCIIIDHGGNTMRHGFIAEDRDFDLDGEIKNVPVRKTTCFACKFVHTAKACPECGHVNKKTKKEEADEAAALVGSTAAALEEMDADKLRILRNYEIEFFRQSLDTQVARGHNFNYANMKFKEKFGRWPAKEIGIKPVWPKPYIDGGPIGFIFQGIEVSKDPKPKPRVEYQSNPANDPDELPF